MKLVAVIIALLFVLHLSHQTPKVKKCTSEFRLTDAMMDICGVIECDREGHYKLHRCVPKKCRHGRRIGYENPNNKKPYPACCGGEVCSHGPRYPEF